MKQKALVETEWRGIDGAELESAEELQIAQGCGRAIKNALRDRFASDGGQALMQVILWTDGKSVRVHEAWHNTDSVVPQVRQTLQRLKALKAAGLTVI